MPRATNGPNRPIVAMSAIRPYTVILDNWHCARTDRDDSYYLGRVEDEVAERPVRNALGCSTGSLGGEKDGLLRGRWSMHA